MHVCACVHLTYTDTYMQVCAYTYIRTYINTYCATIHTCIDTYIRPHVHSCIQACIHQTRTHLHPRAYIYIYIHTHTRLVPFWGQEARYTRQVKKYTDTNTHTHLYTHIYIYMYTVGSYMLLCTLCECMHAGMCVYMYIYTQLHMYVCV